MAIEQNQVLTFEDVTINARNFGGYRFKDGKRSFGILLDNETAERMREDGWPVKKTRPPKNGEVPDGWEPQQWLKINITYKYMPPEVYIIGANGKKALDEDTLELLDKGSFDRVDLSIRAYFWTNEDRQGLRAELSEFYGTLKLSPLAIKYADNVEEETALF